MPMALKGGFINRFSRASGQHQQPLGSKMMEDT